MTRLRVKPCFGTSAVPEFVADSNGEWVSFVQAAAEIAALRAGREAEYNRGFVDGCKDRDKPIASLRVENAAMREALMKLRREHHVCEDGWYSCPKSGECLNASEGDECKCGADAHNAIIDAALSRPATPKEET